MPALITLSNIVLGGQANSNSARKPTKDRIIGKEAMTLSVYTDDFILHGENPRKSTNNLNLINLFNTVFGF